MNNLSTALNQSDERNQALQERLLLEASEPSWVSKQGGRLFNSVGIGLVALGEKLKNNQPDFQIEPADNYAQDTV
jgi:hypothetical protein